MPSLISTDLVTTIKNACLLVAFAIIAGTGVSSSLGAAAPVASKRITFGGDANYPPFHFRTKSGRADGFDVNLFESVADSRAIDADYQLDAWDKTISALAAGDVDVVPMFVTEDRAARYLFSKPFLHRYHLVFGRRGSDYVAGLAGLEGKRTAVQRSGLAWEALIKVRNVPVVPVEVEHEALIAVAKGEADYALVPMLIGYDAQRRHELDDIVAISPPLLELPYAFAISPLRPDLVDVVNAGIEHAVRTGTHDRLYQEWLAPDEKWGAQFALWLVFPALCLAAVAVAWWRSARTHALAAVHQREAAEARAEFLAYHDHVTGLPKLSSLVNELDAWSEQEASWLALRIDLVDLASVEAIAGQQFIERALSALARRIERTYPDGMVASVGRRGFAVCCKRPNEPEEAKALIRSAIEVVQSRMKIAGTPIELRCRAGLAMYPSDGSTAAAVLRAASMACSVAHERNAKSVIYDASIEPDPRNLTLVAELREAIREGAMDYAIQPKLDLASRRVIGGEMLVRWDHPRHGRLSPDAFIPLAERTGVIGELTQYLVHQASAHLCEWERSGTPVSLAVNVSVNDLANHELVLDILSSTNGVSKHLILELTETDVMRNQDAILWSVELLRAASIRISLDDFGTGHSSMTYLKRLAPDEVKIDRSFVSQALASDRDRSIVSGLLQMAHSLRAVVTAEGVEDERTLQWLAEQGCDAAQGYWIARPMPRAEFSELLRRRSAAIGPLS